ncbi:MAG: hypothetical protein FWG10_11725 [Eubacteriaceae bacterium]|nr:hypothetical protein [Eubacteriaceae bacterium]
MGKVIPLPRLQGLSSKILENCPIPGRVAPYHHLPLSITLAGMRENLGRQWDGLMALGGGIDFKSLGEEPEQICKRRIPAIARYLDWQGNEYKELVSLVEKAGLNLTLEFAQTELDSDVARIQKSLARFWTPSRNMSKLPKPF